MEVIYQFILGYQKDFDSHITGFVFQRISFNGVLHDELLVLFVRQDHLSVRENSSRTASSSGLYHLPRNLDAADVVLFSGGEGSLVAPLLVGVWLLAAEGDLPESSDFGLLPGVFSVLVVAGFQPSDQKSPGHGHKKGYEKQHDHQRRFIH